MVVLVAIMHAKAGKEAELETALKAVFPKVKQEEGTVQYILHASKTDPGKFLFYEKYKDKAALDFHGSTPYLQQLFTTIEPLLAGKPDIELFDEIASIAD